MLRLLALVELADADCAAMIRTRFCGARGCWTLIVLTPGTSNTNRCSLHEGVANAPESSKEAVKRIVREVGLKR